MAASMSVSSVYIAGSQKYARAHAAIVPRANLAQNSRVSKAEAELALKIQEKTKIYRDARLKVNEDFLKQPDDGVPGADESEEDMNKPCETCASRQYQDQSNDPGVSFQAPSSLPASSAGVSVMAHENEHVRRETSRAHEEDRIVTNKHVTFKVAFCPECGRKYIAGGETSITTAQKNPQEDVKVQTLRQIMGGLGEKVDAYA